MLKLTVKFADIGADNGFGDNEVSIRNKLRQYLDFQFPEWDDAIIYDSMKVNWEKMKVSVKIKTLHYYPQYENIISHPKMFQAA